MDDRGVISWVIDGITSGTTAAGLGRITPTGSWEVTVQIDVSRANRGSALAGAGLPILADNAPKDGRDSSIGATSKCASLADGCANAGNQERIGKTKGPAVGSTYGFPSAPQRDDP